VSFGRPARVVRVPRGGRGVGSTVCATFRVDTNRPWAQVQGWMRRS